MSRHRYFGPATALGLLMLASPGGASETITYQYDVHGRLVKVEHSGSINSGLSTNYAFDKADNRAKLIAGPGVLLTVDGASAVEGEDIVFTVTKTGSATSTVTVNYATAHGTAGGWDYSSRSGTLTFATSEIEKTVAVPTLSDGGWLNESDETFSLNLSSPTGGATIVDAQAIGTIIDDD